MARRNPFANLTESPGPASLHSVRDYPAKGASRSMLRSVVDMAAQADTLLDGEAIVELDPALVKDSFIRDRLDTEGPEFDEFVEVIRAEGQSTPILVRPHPAEGGMFMVVFGHRRLRAAGVLGRKVRAVVREMSDRDHVVAQGQENSARSNLSFIERALFAAQLTRLHYDEDYSVVMAALTVDRATLSKLLSVADIPREIVEAIGRAKGIGRDRWYDLKLALDKAGSPAAALRALGEDGFEQLSSDERFHRVLALAKAATRKRKERADQLKSTWTASDGAVMVEMTSKGRRYTLELAAKGPEAKAFGQYVSESLDELYQSFRRQTA